MHPCGNGGCNCYVLRKVVFKILMISIPSVMVAMYCFNQGKKLFLVTFHVDRKVSVLKSVLLLLLLLLS